MKKKNLLMIAIAIVGLATITMAQTVPSYVPTTGLVGWWPFNGNANDESGNANNGTVNGATLTTDRIGNINKAYSFDGTSNRISLGNAFPTIGTPNSAASISLWFKTDVSYISGAFNLDPTGTIIGDYKRQGQCCELNYLVSLNLNEGPTRLIWNQRGAGVDYNTSVNTNYINNIWHNIVLVVDGFGTKKIYIDGGLISSQSYNASANYADQTSPWESDWQIGAAHWNDGGNSFDYINYFKGLVDDIGIWNRALTQQEITDVYNGCQLSVNTQPANQTININNNAQFVVSSSDPGASYQWQTDLGVGFQNLNSVGQYSGTTNDTLTIANTTLSNNNQPFRCIISSGSCTDTSAVAVLTVVNNVGINEFTHDNLFSVYPNPAHSQINVKADAKLLGSVYTIYDNTGKSVLTGKINSDNTFIELGNLSGGIYLFSVGENMKQTFKVIKE